MYNDAIERLRKEINEREEVISLISRFNELTLDEKLFAVKNSFLRYERDEMPDILQKDFKSDVLRQGEAFIDINELCIEVDNYSFEVALYDVKKVFIKTDNKIKDMTFRTYHEIDESIHDKISKLENFIDNPNFSTFREVISYLYKNPKLLNKISFIFDKKGVLEYAGYTLADLKSGLHYRKSENEKYETDLKNNELFAKQHQEFLDSISEDIKYFENKGYSISYNFKNEIF